MTSSTYSITLLLLICSYIFVNGDNVGKRSDIEEKLFPVWSNHTSPVDQYRRALTPDPNNPPEGVDTAVCVICHGLSYCDVLNGLLVQEVYYPKQDDLGTCSIIEALGIRMDQEIFGIGRTFRDSPQCRDIVMQYLCLFWGSQNDMYTNLCFWKEDVSSPDPQLHKISPRPPCRSFCVQVYSSLYGIPSYQRSVAVHTPLINGIRRSQKCVLTRQTLSTCAVLSHAHPQRMSARQVRDHYRIYICIY